MFARAARFRELRPESRIESISAALEPIQLTAVAAVVGTVLIAIFIPLYRIVANLAWRPSWSQVAESNIFHLLAVSQS